MCGNDIINNCERRHECGLWRRYIPGKQWEFQDYKSGVEGCVMTSFKWRDAVVVKCGQYRGQEFIISTIDHQGNIWLRKAAQSQKFSAALGPFSSTELEKVYGGL